MFLDWSGLCQSTIWILYSIIATKHPLRKVFANAVYRLAIDEGLANEVSSRFALAGMRPGTVSPSSSLLQSTRALPLGSVVTGESIVQSVVVVASPQSWLGDQLPLQSWLQGRRLLGC